MDREIWLSKDTDFTNIQKIEPAGFENIATNTDEGAYDFLAPFLDYGLYISFEQSGVGICVV